MSENDSRPNEIKIGMLLGNIGRLHATRANWFWERIGLFRGQAILLIILAEQDGLPHSEIARKLGVTPGALTKVVRRMETLQYVERRPDPLDERVSRVFLQAEGWAKIHEISQTFELIDRALVNNMTEEQQSTLIELLQMVFTNLLVQPGAE
jgi:DNA-binding MarR family transcriptional regulator